MICELTAEGHDMRRYYFPIFHNGETQADCVGELFGSADLASEYAARVAWDIASDPEYDSSAGTVVIVLDSAGAEMARHRVGTTAERDLDDMERAEQTAEYIKKTGEKLARDSGKVIFAEVRQKLKSDTNPKGAGRNESGLSAACRELDIADSTARDGITQERGEVQAVNTLLVVAKNACGLGHRMRSKSSMTSASRSFAPLGIPCNNMCRTRAAISSRRIGLCSA
jgi:hypothetical protein